MTEELLVVIGIGQDGPKGLSPEALDHIARAKVMAGGRRHLAFFPEWKGKKILVDADLEGAISQIKESYRQEKTAVLASGDPLFYGIGRRLVDSFPKEDLLFIPHLSSVQVAFARIKESWEDACVVSLHGRPMESLLPALENREAKIALFTDAKNHPAALGRFLVEHGFENYTLWVCEELGGPHERVTQWSPQSIQNASMSPLNVVILLRKQETAPRAAGALPLLGIPEEAILDRSERQGMITKREVRLISLCYLELHAQEVLWDVGAGSGSISLEAARLAPALKVFAIERSELSYHHMEANARRFGLANIQPVLGEAPAIFSALPDPDAVFVGGSGGQLEEIISAGVGRLRPGGRVVMNCITLESFSMGWKLLKRQGLLTDVTSIQLAHARLLGKLHHFQPENPIFIFRGKKK